MADSYVQHLIAGGRDTDWDFGRAHITREAALLTQEEAHDFEDFMTMWLELFTLSSLPGIEGVRKIDSEQRYYYDLESQQFITRAQAEQPHRTVFAYTADLTWRSPPPFGELHLLDWKSGRVIEHIERPESNLQLATYLFMETLRQGKAGKYFAHVYHMRHCHLESAEITREHLEKTWQDVVIPIIQDWIARNPAKDFPPTIGKHCGTCRFAKDCPANPDVETYSCREGAEGLVQIAGWARARAESWESTLKAAVAEDGPLEAGDFLADLHTQTTRRWKPGWLATLLKEIPVEDIEKAITPSHEKLRKAYAKYGVEDGYEKSIQPFEIAKLKTVISISRKRHPRLGTNPGETYSEPSDD